MVFVDSLETQVSNLERENAKLREDLKAQALGVDKAIHDIRSPIVNLFGFYKELFEDINSAYEKGELLSEEQMNDAKEGFEFVFASKEKIEVLLTDMLAIAKLRSGKIPLNTEYHSLNNIIDFSTKENEAFLSEGQEITYKCQGDLVINCDEYKFGEVISNLIKNGIEALDGKGEVEISYFDVPKSHSGAREDKYVICISDTGKGISVEDKPHIFEDFYTRGKGNKGTGLGLASCKAIVEKHGWKINVYSDGPGKGASLHISLPASDIKPADQ